MATKQNLTAIIYDRKGRILSIGKNSYVKTHPMMAKMAYEVGENHNRVFLHAEIDAIVKCRQLDKAYRIEIFRYNKQGKPQLAAPCPICQGAIKKTTIKEIVFTTGERN